MNLFILTLLHINLIHLTDVYPRQIGRFKLSMEKCKMKF
uniref:Uncharacterized protein n=1 Tax=Anguilla anguilla TaxID=7936 RepID=A0A0E9WJW5_ANGAN